MWGRWFKPFTVAVRGAPAPDEPVAQLEQTELLALRDLARRLNLGQATAARAGLGVSRRRGRGLDYYESRHYQPGDEVRHVDWRVTARTGHMHTKIYRDAREMPVWLVIDATSSLWFGTRRALKVVQLARLAALIGWATSLRGDRVGWLTPAQTRPPQGGTKGVTQLVHSLVALQPADDWSLEEALQQLTPQLRGGQLWLLGDASRWDDALLQQLAHVRARIDCRLAQVIDPFEETAFRGVLRLSDGDRSQRWRGGALQPFYADQRAGWQHLTAQAQRYGLRFDTVRTTDELSHLAHRLSL